VIKRRNIYSEQLADLANLYFRMSGIPIRFWSKAEDWRRWEVKCFRMLNGDRFRAFAYGAKTVCTDKLSLGTSERRHARGECWKRLERSFGARINSGATNLTARGHMAIRRRQMSFYNQKTGRARLIDFELVHHRSLSAKSRHADDLLVFLLDILAIASSRQWLPFALCFPNTYGDPIVLAELTNPLALPNGIAWIWWGVRTSFANPAKVKQRLERIKDVTANLDTIERLRPNAHARAKGDALQ
jgi:hypothetical protein